MHSPILPHFWPINLFMNERMDDYFWKTYPQRCQVFIGYIYTHYINHAHNILVQFKALSFIGHIWPIALSLDKCGDECIWRVYPQLFRSLSWNIYTTYYGHTPQIPAWCKALGLIGIFGPFLCPLMNVVDNLCIIISSIGLDIHIVQSRV